MTSIDWDPKAREFLRKLPRNIANRIFNKVDHNKNQDNLIIRSIRHRRDAYKK